MNMLLMQICLRICCKCVIWPRILCWKMSIFYTSAAATVYRNFILKSRRSLVFKNLCESWFQQQNYFYFPICPHVCPRKTRLYYKCEESFSHKDLSSSLNSFSDATDKSQPLTSFTGILFTDKCPASVSVRIQLIHLWICRCAVTWWATNSGYCV